MARKKIGAIITLDNQKEFKADVASCNKSLAEMKSEMKLVEAQTIGNANSLDSLKKKHEVLTKTLEEQIKKEERVKAGFDQAQATYNKVGAGLEGYKKQLAEAKTKLEEMTASGTASEEELEAQRKQIEYLEGSVKKSEEAYRTAGGRVSDWNKQLNNAKAQTINATKAVQENETYMNEASMTVDKCAVSIDKFGKKVDTAADYTEEMNSLLASDIAIDLYDDIAQSAEKLVNSIYDAAKTLDEGYDTIMTKTGAAGEALDGLTKSADNIFADMPVEMEQVGIAVGEVNTRFGQTGETLEKTSRDFLRFAEINDADLNESIDATDRILTQFNVDAQYTGEILGLMTKKSQETGKTVSSMMSELDDNAATLKELDLDLVESTNLLALFETNGVDASTALKGLKTAVNEYAKEGISAREGLEQTILSIKNAKSDTEALAIAQETFGVKGAQVMSDGIREGRINLDDLSESMGKYSSIVEDTYNATLDPWDELTVATNNLKVAGSDLAGAALTTLTPAIEIATDVAKGAREALEDMPKPIKTFISLLGVTGAAAITLGPKIGKVVTTVKSLKVAHETAKALKTMNDIQKAAVATSEASAAATAVQTAATGANTVATEVQTVATGTATVAQKGLNAAVLANPYVLATAGVIAFVGALALLYTEEDNVAKMTNELYAEVDATSKKMQEIAKGLEEATEKMSESLAEVEAKGNAADELITELYELEAVSNKSSSQVSRMSAIVSELTAMYPELNLSIDQNTGALSDNEQQTRNSVEAALDLQKAAAAQEKLAELAGEMAEADIERYRAEQNVEKITKRLNELEKERERLLKESNDSQKDTTTAQGSYAAALSDTRDALTKNVAEIDRMQEALEIQATEMENLNQVYDDANEQYMLATDYINELTGVTVSKTEADKAAEEQSKANIEVAGQELVAFNNLSVAQQELAVNVTNSVLSMQENVQSALESQMNMFEEFNAGTVLSTETLLSNMESQIAGVQQWEQNLASLAEKGINQDLLQKLAAMGPEGAGYVQTFVNMSDEELKQANDLWNQSIDVKAMTDTWGEELISSGAENIASGMTGIEEVMRESGADTVMGLVEGVQGAQAEAEAVGEDLGVKTIDSINEGLGVASPSTKTKQSGADTDKGLVLGLQSNIGAVKSAGETVGKTAITAIASSASIGEAKKSGYNVAVGFASGIESGRSQVISASTAMAQSAILAARQKLDIHSPSRAFGDIGELSMDGYILGISRKQKAVQEAVNNTMSFSSIRTGGSIDNISNSTQDYNMLVAALSEAMKNNEMTVVWNMREFGRVLTKARVN